MTALDAKAQADIEGKARFITQAHAAIEKVENKTDLRHVIAACEANPFWEGLGTPAQDEILHHLERKRLHLMRAAGAP